MVKRYVPIALNSIYASYGLIKRPEDVPIGDKDNLGAKLERQIQKKYEVKEAIVEQFDEYGEELQFSDKASSSDGEESKAEESQEENEPSLDGESS